MAEREVAVARRALLLTLAGLILVVCGVPTSVPGSAAAPSAPSSDTPVVTGDLLNPLYFAHGACVMQGVEDRDKIFAMPLLGIPELGFMPTQEGIDTADVTWSVRVSSPTGVAAEIADGVLYIWANSASWAGYGEVVLMGATSTGSSGSVAIPVVVFRADKTLIDAEGKKSYFVPWSPQLDINRVLSVEEHMRRYGKGEGRLDRTIQFSKARPMQNRKDVDLLTTWFSESVLGGYWWSEEAQFALVDVYLDEFVWLGVDSIRLWDIYYVEGLDGTAVRPVYDKYLYSVTRHPHETAYVVNEAHRLGLSVLLGNSYIAYEGDHAYELWDAQPVSLTEFYASVTARDNLSLADWLRLGVDIVGIGRGLTTVGHGPQSREDADRRAGAIVEMVRAARKIYPGPVYGMGLPLLEFYPGRSELEARFWSEFDILGAGLSGLDVSADPHPTLSEATQGWKDLIQKYFRPFQERFGKPFLAEENGCFAVEGCMRWGAWCELIMGQAFDASRVEADEMRMWYLSQDAAFSSMPGYFGPGWHFFVLDPYRTGSIRYASPNPRMMLEGVIQQLFLGSSKARHVTIDADLSDWRSEYYVGADAAGDSRGESDLLGLWFTQDDMYVYLRVDYVRPPHGWLIIEVDADGDRRLDFSLFLNDVYTYDGTWWGQSFVRRPDERWLGFADSIDVSSTIEMRVPKRFVASFAQPSAWAVRLLHHDASWNREDEMGWLALAP